MNSKNEQMVSVPNILAADNDRDMLEYLSEGYASQVYVCEQCGHEEPLETYDLASDLREYLAAYPGAPAAQHQGEPVAYQFQGRDAGVDKLPKWRYCPECGSDEVRHQEGEHKQCAACHQEWFSDIDYSDTVRVHLAGKYIDKDATIDRLRAEVRALRKTLPNSTTELVDLRAQLVEQDALLQYIDDQLTNLQPHIVQACYPGRAGFIDNYVDPVIERIRTISASAEPSAPDNPNILDAMAVLFGGKAEASAPVERDERAEFLAWANDEYEVGEGYELNESNFDIVQNWKGWQARAALERKP